MYLYNVYTVHIYSYFTVLCVNYWYSHTLQDEGVSPLTPRKYTVLNGNFVFDLCNFNLCNFSGM